jgi:tRNA threonylcarbamoyladenosine biosynthesis protein TsaE
MKIITQSPEETIALGQKLAQHLKPADVLGLIGEFGAGKTTLVKGVAQGLGVKEREHVSSPSFVIVKEYEGRIPLFHLDLYRLDNLTEIEYLGFGEYLFDEGVCVIEWAERMKMLLPDYLEVRMAIKGEKSREITFIPHTRRYEEIVGRLLK